MFLNIKEMEVRRIRFDETFEPGQIDFSDTGLRQVTGVHAEGSAEVLENTGGEIRVQGRFTGTFSKPIVTAAWRWLCIRWTIVSTCFTVRRRPLRPMS